MNKPKSKFIISNWKNNLDWIDDYTDNYLIYDKSDTLQPGDKILKVRNVGHNIFDSLNFILNYYYNLPDYTAFLQGNPWDHCRRDIFDKLIYNECFTPLEYYGPTPGNNWEGRTPEGMFLEVNNSWYLHLDPPYQHIFYNSFDEFMNEIFVDYDHVNWVRFSPGAQYIVPKNNILNYSYDFWSRLEGMVDYAQYACEAHLIERAMYYIFSNIYEERI